MSSSEIILNPKQQMAIDEADGGSNLFITGSGGVGKSVVIHTLQEKLGKRALFLAPTGIAALNIYGSTLHRVFGLPFSIALDSDYNNIQDKTAELFKDGTITTIVIDEISMVRGDMFVCIDKKLRRLKRTSKPFGGLQVIVVGDFFQLPPVLTRNEEDVYHEKYGSIYAFAHSVWDNLNFKTIILDQVMRQEDDTTVRALNAVRHGSKSPNVLRWINTQCVNAEVSEECVTLCTTNAVAKLINDFYYDDIQSDERMFYAEKTGRFNDKPVDDTMGIKVGMRVIMCANNNAAGYSNGECGEVSRISDAGYVEVELDNGATVIVEPHTWEAYSYRNTAGVLSKMVDGSFTQLPLKMGYAITIHKSQGMTLDEAILDLGNGAFSHGQTYVALSRIRSFNTMQLEREVRSSDIIVDQEVIDFYKKLEAA